LQLLNQRRRDGQSHKDREKPRLHVDVTVPQMPERKSIEKAREDVKHELALVQIY
jgi:hypothetical protein